MNTHNIIFEVYYVVERDQSTIEIEKKTRFIKSKKMMLSIEMSLQQVLAT